MFTTSLRGGRHRVAILAALAPFDAQHHALRVDVRHLQRDHLGNAQICTVGKLTRSGNAETEVASQHNQCRGLKRFLGECRWVLTILFDAQPSAEHRHLLGAAEGGKGIGGDAGGVFGPRVVRTGNGLMCRKRGLCDGQCLGGAPRVEKEARIGDLRTAASADGRGRAPFSPTVIALREERLGVRVANIPQQAGKIAETRRYLGMLGAEHLLGDCKRALTKRPRPARSPWPASTKARSLRPAAVKGCSGPSTFS